MNSKWTLLYEYSKDLFDKEVDRFKRLDDKANNQLRFTYILLTIYIALLKVIIIDNTSYIDIFILIFVLLSFIFLLVAWLFYFLSLKLTTVPKLPLTDDILSLFKDNEIVTIEFALHGSIKKAIYEYDRIILKKAKNLRYGYNLTILSVLFIIVTTGVISYNYFESNHINFKKEQKMSDKKTEGNNNSQADSSQPQNNQPDFNVNIPDIQYATEGYEVDTTKYQKLIEEETNKTKTK